MLLTPHADPKTSECFDNQNQGSTSGQIERIFGLVCHMFSVATTLPSWHKSSHRWHRNKRAGLCANKTLPTQTGSQPTGHCLPTPNLNEAFDESFTLCFPSKLYFIVVT